MFTTVLNHKIQDLFHELTEGGNFTAQSFEKQTRSQRQPKIPFSEVVEFKEGVARKLTMTTITKYGGAILCFDDLHQYFVWLSISILFVIKTTKQNLKEKSFFRCRKKKHAYNGLVKIR